MRGSPYTCVYREIWDDPKFWSLTDTQKLVYFYILTTPMGNGIGCFKAGMAAMVEESRMVSETFKLTFDECSEMGFFKYDAYNRVLFIPTYFERNKPSNPNGIVAVSKDFVRVPDSPLKGECYQVIEEWCRNKGGTFLERFHETFDKPSAENDETSAEQPGIIFPSPSPSPSPTKADTPTNTKAQERERPPAREAKPVPKSAKKTSPYTAPFLSFWDTWSRIVNNNAKFEASERWKKMSKAGDLPSVDDLIAHVVRQDLERTAKRNAGEFVAEWKNLPSWLYRRRWEDKYEITGKPTNGNGSAPKPQPKQERYDA